MNNIKHACKHTLNLLLFCLLFYGCTVRQSVVSTAKCTAPCWEGISPGYTSYEDSLLILQNLENVDNSSVIPSGPWSIFTNGISFQLYSGETAGISIIDDTVIMVSFRKPGGILSISECIQRFGTPSFIKQSHVLGPGFPLVLGSDAEHPWLYAVYPSEGISLGYDMYRVWTGPNYSLEPDTQINEIQYFDPKQYDLLLENGMIINSLSDIRQSDLYPWKGYGNVNDLYPFD
ncbi:MAG: hypothetical protein JW704_09420 [Anaerolineaceae bacterium]|nr:hypothetical protein [Anaerolineaceae bacterium]